ncbi:MAG: AMP-binding protein [Actinomycetota bacterium]|jgi:acyl-CoA synthetase (AMP-forming)/AMP-acid ligase II|nr:AMP-binding protein [Actinomycetota bacterium]
MAEAFGDETAYSVVDGGSITFAEWDVQANRLARGLLAMGVAPDDPIAIHLSFENALRWIVAYSAIHRAGAVAVPLNPRLAQAEVGRMLGHCRARAVVSDDARVSQDAEELGRRASESPAFVIDASATPMGPTGTQPVKTVGWIDVLDPSGDPIQVPRDDDDLADIIYTSGTTGSPKGVAVRHVNASLVPPGPPSWSGGSWLHASPLCTFAGLGFVYNPMKLGLRGIYQPRFDAGRWIEVVEHERPVAVFLVPAMTHLLLDHPRFSEADLSSVQICAIGSAPLAPFVIERLQAKMPDAMISNNYGMTEAGSVYCLTPKGEAVKRPGSVGRPAPPAEVRIVDDEGVEVPAGHVGDVRLRIPGRAREYFDDPGATASTWVDGWLITGDLGKVDEDGYLYIVGRRKDVIIRGGNNIHAADVEHVIVSHPDVAEAAVVGVPHPVLGEDVVAFVALRPGAKTTINALRAHCLESLADYKVPREWHVVDTLPRNATGKVVKPELQAMLNGPLEQHPEHSKG